MTDLDEIQKRLKSMADVVNAFKSEAVQLRVMEVLLGQLDVLPPSSASSETGESTSGRRTGRRKTKRRPKADQGPADVSAASKPGVVKGPKKNRGSGSPGGFAMVSQLMEDGFFRKAQTIGSITSHCSTSKGHHYKANEISPGLLRLIRNGTLKRAKNKDGQYEYTQA